MGSPLFLVKPKSFRFIFIAYVNKIGRELLKGIELLRSILTVIYKPFMIKVMIIFRSHHFLRELSVRRSVFNSSSYLAILLLLSQVTRVVFGVSAEKTTTLFFDINYFYVSMLYPLRSLLCLSLLIIF